MGGHSLKSCIIMAHNSLSGHRLPTNDPFPYPTSSNIAVEAGASSLYYSHRTFGQIHGSDCTTDFSFDTAGASDNAHEKSINRLDSVKESELNPTASGLGLESQSALPARWLPNRPSGPHLSNEMTPGFSRDCSPSLYGNMQHQPGWGFVSPPVTSMPLSRPSTSQHYSSMPSSPFSGEDISASRPKSVKHLTCWYWANQGCKLPDHLCLYSHFDTGRLAEAPIQKQRGRESSFYRFPRQ